jgi:hypothetical protein
MCFVTFLLTLRKKYNLENKSFYCSIGTVQSVELENRYIMCMWIDSNTASRIIKINDLVIIHYRQAERQTI